MGNFNQVIYFTKGLKEAIRKEIVYKSDNLDKAIAPVIHFNNAMFSSKQFFIFKIKQKKIYKKVELDQVKSFTKKETQQKDKFKKNCYKCQKLKHIMKNCKVKKQNLNNIEETQQ
jgi:hypothetical protein